MVGEMMMRDCLTMVLLANLIGLALFAALRPRPRGDSGEAGYAGREHG